MLCVLSPNRIECSTKMTSDTFASFHNHRPLQLLWPYVKNEHSHHPVAIQFFPSYSSSKNKYKASCL